VLEKWGTHTGCPSGRGCLFVYFFLVLCFYRALIEVCESNLAMIFTVGLGVLVLLSLTFHEFFHLVVAILAGGTSMFLSVVAWADNLPTNYPPR